MFVALHNATNPKYPDNSDLDELITSVQLAIYEGN